MPGRSGGLVLPESIAVVGAGYVGVVTAACFAELGHSVALHDLEEWKLDGLRNGKAPFFEPGLDALLARGVRSRRLSFHSRLAEALAEADIVFIAVGTPSGPDGSCDTGAVETTLLRASEHLRAGGILAIKSTVAVGTAERLSRVLAWGDNIQALPIVSNPEFLSEGSAIEDFMNPDRIVLGAGDHEAARRVARLYTSLDSPIVITDTSSAEMIKYVANAYLAMRVSFINEVAEMCEAMGADVLDVAHGAGLDHRIGRDFLAAGIGFGGSCFPKDVAALCSQARAEGADHEILASVLAVNRRQPGRIVEKLRDVLGDLEGRPVGVLGLTFKPNTDDCRDSPALALVDALERSGAKVVAYDPAVAPWAAFQRPNVVCATTPYEVAHRADALIIATDWDCFHHLDFARIRETMRTAVIVDGRNCLDATSLRQQGFIYLGVGRPDAAIRVSPVPKASSAA